jgi:hypothetical protein
MSAVQAQDTPLLPSASYGIATAVSNDIDTSGCQFLNVIIDITAIGASGTVTCTIQGKDTTSGKYYTILASSALASNATTRLKVGPTIAASANAIAQDYLPKTIRVSVAVAVAASTFSVGASLTD